ncbi:MAG: FtsW/RodA/SpoVE family cell cycle protein [Bacilli bacterium]|nr:FtsW/RodA/SpoVE family cell cycle protein [Bacilli bacterium]
MKKYIKKYTIIIPILILNIISSFYLYNTNYFYKQLIFIILGITLLLISSKLKIQNISKYIPYIYTFNIFLLILVLIIGKEINGAKAWLHLFGFSLQPSELMKVSLILTLTYLINKPIPILFIITLIPSVLTFLEPDTGSIIMFLIIFLSTLKYKKLNKKITIITISIITIFLLTNICIYFFNKDILINIYGTKLFYRIDRLISFKNLDNIQNKNSLISIGANELLYIPENHNDFIFAAILSKYNIIITITILTCLSTILIHYIKKAKKQKRRLNIINYMILNLLLFQTFYNILMNLSLVPIIGIPLPFLSYGGSNLITLYLLIGLSLNTSINKGNKDNLVHTLVDKA